MTWLLLGIMVVATVFGDLLQSREMKRSGAQNVNVRGLLALLKQIGNRLYLVLAIVCMAISFFATLLPATSMMYAAFRHKSRHISMSMRASAMR